MQPSQVVAAADLQTIQLYNLVNREGWNLQQTHDWTDLQALKVVNITRAITTTGTYAASSAVITGIPTTAGIVANTWVVSGAAIPVAARVVSVDSANQITMDMLTTAAGTAVTLTFAQDTYNIPTDYDRFINSTHWDRTNRWPVIGPDSPQIDEWHRSGIVVTGPRRHFRQVGTLPAAYRLWPPPGATETPWETVFEYIQNTWAQTSGGTGISKMTADTDISLVDPQAIILGVKWRFFQAKQFDYAAMQAEYIDYVNARIARDGGAKTLSMAACRTPYLLTSAQVADGFWPSS